MSDLDEATPTTGGEGQDRVSGQAQDAAFRDLQRRHALIAAELARLSAILESAGQGQDAQAELEQGRSSAPAPAYETAPMSSGWERAQTGGVVRGPGVRPDAQRVIHLGTQRTYVGRRRKLASWLSAAAVGAVVAAALILLVMVPRWNAERSGFADTLVGVATESPLPTAAPQPTVAAPPPVEQPPPPEATTDATLDAILVRARSIPQLNEETTELIRRLPALSALSGAARAEEAADIYGLAVTAARTDDSGIAEEIVTALEPEVTVDAVLALADRRPDVVGRGVEALMADLAALPSLPPATQQQEAQQIMDAVAAGVANQTIAGPFCNSIAKALMEYGAQPPA